MSGIESLDVLAEQFARLPGIGRKSSERLALAILNYSPDDVEEFVSAMRAAKERIHRCPVCQNLTDREICPVCADPTRDVTTICVVEDARAVMAFEKVRTFRGVYHVLHGVISPLNHVTQDDIRIKELLTRVAKGGVKEVIMATNPDVEGEATAMYISGLLKPLGVKVTRLAQGVSIGAELEYADEVTLYRAMEGRRNLN